MGIYRKSIDWARVGVGRSGRAVEVAAGWSRASVGTQAYGEGGDVVVETSSAVAEEVAVKSREQFAGRCRGLSTHPGCQREELPVMGSGLGDPVGVEEQQVAGGEVERVDVVVIADQLREAEQG